MVKKQVRQQHTQYKHLIVAVGYILFTCAAFGVLFGQVVHLWHLVANPHAAFEISASLIVSVLVSALAPAVIGYFVGDVSTRDRRRQGRHYTGIMFALLAFWVSVLTNEIMSVGESISPNNAISLALMLNAGFVIPILVTALVIGVLAYRYHRGRGKQEDIINYRPFGVSLLAAITATIILIPLEQFLMDMRGSNGFGDAAITAVILLAAVCVSYVFLMDLRAHNWQKVILAAVGSTLAVVTVYTVQLSVIIIAPSLSAITMILSVLLVWLLYILITRQSYGTGKRG